MTLLDLRSEVVYAVISILGNNHAVFKMGMNTINKEQISSNKVSNVNGKRRRGRAKTAYSSNITTWMSENMERITRDSRDHVECRTLVQCAGLSAYHHS